jgi:hypothetical protein
MAISLTHTTVAVGTDAGNGEIGKAQWNEAHTLTMATGNLLGRSTSGTGAAEEIAIGTGLDLTGGTLSSTVTATPGGSDTQVQFNDGGSFGGDAGLTFNKTSKAITLGGATVTTSSPVIDAAQTWNAVGTTFTGLKFNVTDTASASASLLMDLQVGGVTQLSVGRSGAIANRFGIFRGGSTATACYLGYAGVDYSQVRQGGFNTVGFLGLTTAIDTLSDVLLTRRAAANLRFGAADAAAPVAQTLSVQSVVAGTTNTAGANLTITGSQGTGTGAGGSIIFQVAPAGSSGTAQNALATALTINSAQQVVLASGSASVPSITFDTASTGIYGGGNSINFTRGGKRVASIDPNTFVFFSNIANISLAAEGGSPDVRLFREGANILALRNEANAQTNRLYGTFTDSSNYRRLAMTMSTAGVAEIKPEGAGTGASGNVIHISGLPTSNPGPGILWNNGGTPAIGT